MDSSEGLQNVDTEFKLLRKGAEIFPQKFFLIFTSLQKDKSHHMFACQKLFSQMKNTLQEVGEQKLIDRLSSYLY